MEETMFIEKAIESLDYRRHIEENKIELSDWDLATLLYNNKKLTHEEILCTLQELAVKTTDEILKKQIQERISYDRELYELFKQPAENAYYEVSCWESSYKNGLCFTNFDEAYKYIFEEDGDVRITRWCFDDKDHYPEDEGVWGSVVFSHDGEMGNYFSLYISGGKIKLDDGDIERFENRGLNLPLMYREGDVVYVPYMDAYGIVTAPEDDIEEEKMRFYAQSEYYDFQVVVDFVYKRGKYQSIFHHGHISPADIEYARFEENDTRKGFIEYLAQGFSNKEKNCNETRAVQRMDEVLKMIKQIWEQYPDLRLGQLLVNACGKKDLFYIEDEDLLKVLQRNKFPIEEN